MRVGSRLGWLLLACGLSACSEGSEPTGRSAPTPSVLAAPVPAPDGIVAELRVEQPAAAWTSLRAAAGGPLATLPRSYGGLWVSLLGLPIGFAGEVAESHPLVAVARWERELDWAVALPLAVPERFLLRARQEAADRLVVASSSPEGVTSIRRTAKGAARGRLPDVSIAVMHGALLVGSSPESIAALGPYLARTSSRRSEQELFAQRGKEHGPLGLAPGAPTLAPGLALVAEGERLAELAALAWPRIEPALGAAASSGIAGLLDPAALRRSAEAALGKVAALQARAALDGDALTVHARVRLGREVPAETRRLGIELTRLLRAPDDSVLVVGWAEPTSDRLAEAKETTRSLLDWIGSATADVGPRAEKALRAVATGRGDATAVGLRCTGVGLTAYAAGASTDDRALRRGLGDLLDLRKHPSVIKRLETAGLKASARRARVPGWPEDLLGLRLRSAGPGSSVPTPPGPAGAASARRDAGSAPERLDPIELLTTVGAGQFVASAGVESADTIRRLVEPVEGRSLEAFIRLRPPPEAPTAPVWAALAVEPLGLARCARGTVEGDWARRLVATLGFAEDPTVAWLEIEAGAGLLAALASDEPARAP